MSFFIIKNKKMPFFKSRVQFKKQKTKHFLTKKLYLKSKKSYNNKI